MLNQISLLRKFLKELTMKSYLNFDLYFSIIHGNNQQFFDIVSFENKAFIIIKNLIDPDLFGIKSRFELTVRINKIFF